MKIIHNEVEKNKATIDLAEKEALLPKWSDWLHQA